MNKRFLILSIIVFLTGHLFAQTVVKGVVKTETGDPIPGVTIMIKSSKTGTVTDVNGKYSIKTSEQDVLVFSAIGMKKQEIPVGKQAQIDVSMADDATTLDEAVVVGYGSQKRANLTSAVEVISPKDVADLPVGNLGAALRGTVNGLSVSGGMTRPGTPATLSIRTPFSFSKDGGSTAPIVVIDDVVQIDGSSSSQAPDYSRFNNLDPSEIESITILKDGAAAIYGARASQGAVIVTTKKGKIGQAPRISYSGLYGWNDATSHPQTLSAYEEGIWWNEFNGPYGANKSASTKRNFFQADELDSLKHMNYDWLGHAWKIGNTARHTISIDGGSERATYFASATYYTQNANLNTGDYNKWTFRAGTTVNVAANLKVGLQLSGDNTYKKTPFNKVGGENLDNDYVMLLKTPKYIPWQLGDQFTYLMLNPYTYPGSNANDVSAFNYFQMQNSDNYSEARGLSYNVNINAEFKVPFVKGLSLRGMFNRAYSFATNNQIGTQYTLLRPTKLGGTGEHLYLQPGQGATYSVDVNSRNGNRMLWDRNYTIAYQENFFVNYEKQIGKHNITAMASVERSESDYNSLRLIDNAPLVNNNGQTNTATGGIDISNSVTGRTQSGNLSYLGRITYNYANKYNFTYLIRSDASSKFAPSNYWGTFHSFGAAWVISEESFFKDNVKFVDFLKLRGTLGLTGKDNTKAWQWRQRYTYQGDKGGIFGTSTSTAITPGYKMEANPTPNAKWDNDTKYDIGLDATMLGGKLSTTIDWWKDHNYNMLLVRSAQIPVTIGGSNADENYGGIDAYGIELSISWKDKITHDLSYSISLQTGWKDTRVKKWDLPSIIYPWTDKQVGKSVDPGKWGYDCLGMFHNQTEIDNYVAQYLTKADGTYGTMLGLAPSGLKPGMLYYRDVRGAINSDGSFQDADKTIDSNDQIRLSKKADNPYGFTTNLGLNYKGIQLNAQLSANWGGWSELDGRTQATNSSAFYGNQASYWADMFDPDLNPNGKYPNQYQISQSGQDGAAGQNVISNFWKISSFRMQINSITLAYSFPKTLMSKLKIEGLRMNLSMTNVASLYNPYPYRDPFTDMTGYPTLRTVSLGVNLTL
ncbi:MAG: SusC/RagA family TonB-linked outer membrane protein [Bacteroidota bacterium]|nr:SusC/RagA family TonB-linked outer membrane protein [Bacteroidota bacterium]